MGEYGSRAYGLLNLSFNTYHEGRSARLIHITQDPSGFDLHCHSSFSDGSMTPKELVEHAYSIGLKGIAITDHDTVGAYDEALSHASMIGITLIPGIEISTEFQGESIHVLGYSYDPSSEIILNACKLHFARREERNRAIVDALNRRGFSMTYEEVVLASPEAKTYGRPHIAKVMVQKGYVETVQQAFKQYLGSSKPCYFAGQKWSTQEAIDIIHKANGYAFLAHPHLISRYQRVKDLLCLPFDGLEGYYSRFEPEVNNRFLRLAMHRKLLVSGGSDFHGSVKPDTKLGASQAPKETIEILLTRLRERARSS